VIGINYPAGVEDKKFRTMLDEKFGVVVAGGFGKLKGSMFRVGSMGEIDERKVSVTVSAIAESLSAMGVSCDLAGALSRSWEILSSIQVSPAKK
jgi:aspartate aminotransferase-like enzyme